MYGTIECLKYTLIGGIGLTIFCEIVFIFIYLKWIGGIGAVFVAVCLYKTMRGDLNIEKKFDQLVCRLYNRINSNVGSSCRLSCITLKTSIKSLHTHYSQHILLEQNHLDLVCIADQMFDISDRAYRINFGIQYISNEQYTIIPTNNILSTPLMQIIGVDTIGPDGNISVYVRNLSSNMFEIKKGDVLFRLISLSSTPFYIKNVVEV